MSKIHHTAIIEEGAILGKDVSIDAFSFIGKNVVIGDNSSVGKYTIVEGHTLIGKHTHIFSHAAIGTIPQDLKYQGEKVELIIGDHNTIREFTLINPGTKGGGSITKIGHHNLLMGYVHLGHDVIVGNHCILANGAALAGHVELGNHVIIGGGFSPIHQFVKIGDYAMIAGASAVTQDVPPYCLAEGNRATLRGLNLVGLRRSFSRESINALKVAYRDIFQKQHPIKEAINTILNQTQSLEVKALCHFIQKSQRGIAFTRIQKEDNK
jgi:UDP-N-acetylglucosamine acyltransferase